MAGPSPSGVEVAEPCSSAARQAGRGGRCGREVGGRQGSLGWHDLSLRPARVTGRQQNRLGVRACHTGTSRAHRHTYVLALAAASRDFSAVPQAGGSEDPSCHLLRWIPVPRRAPQGHQHLPVPVSLPNASGAGPSLRPQLPATLSRAPAVAPHSPALLPPGAEVALPPAVGSTFRRTVLALEHGQSTTRVPALGWKAPMSAHKPGPWGHLR